MREVGGPPKDARQLFGVNFLFLRRWVALIFCINFRVRIASRLTYRTYIRIDRIDLFDFLIRYFIRLLFYVELRGRCAAIALSEDARLIRFNGEDMYTCREFTTARYQSVNEDERDGILCEVAGDVYRVLMLLRQDYVNDLRVDRGLLYFLIARGFDSRLILCRDR